MLTMPVSIIKHWHKSIKRHKVDSTVEDRKRELAIFSITILVQY